MDYKKASQIRKKSLLSLIAEKKFEEGEGLGSSIGGAISDKFKAKITGVKEKFDPLNMLKAITGDGVIGKSILTLGGRAMGKSDEDIDYFGGYARKRNKNKKKVKNKKDPQFTTISSGPIVMVKSGDSIANILGKMYNFMQKTYERSKLSNEIEKAFRTEQLEEDERRHKKIIDALLNRKKDPSKPEEDNGVGSFIKKLLDGIKMMLAPILSVIGSLTSMIVPLLTSLASTIVSVIAGSADLIVKTLLSPLTLLIRSLIGSAFSILMRNLVGPALSLLATPVGAVLALFAGGAVAAQVVRANQETRMGKEAVNLEDKQADEERNLELKYPGIGDKNSSEYRKEKNELIKRHAEETKNAREKFEKETLIPAMERIGFKPKDNNSRNKAGELEFIDKEGKEAGQLDYVRAIEGEDWMEKLIIKQVVGENITVKQYTEKAIKELTEKVKTEVKKSLPEMPSVDSSKLPDELGLAKGEEVVANAIKGKMDAPKASVDVIQAPTLKREDIPVKNIPGMIQDNFPVEHGEWNKPNIISMNKTNNFGSKESKTQYAGSTKVRDDIPQNYFIQATV